MDASRLYDLLSTRALTEQGLYLNLGYWEDAQTINEACAAMASLLAEAAAMRPEDDVVDVGFGFPEQDMLSIERFAPRHITGLNVTASPGANRPGACPQARPLRSDRLLEGRRRPCRCGSDATSG